MFAAFALLSALDRTNRKRFGNAAFWGLMALSLLAGSWLGDFANGLLVLGLAGLAGFGLIGRGAPPTTSDGERAAWSQRLGNRLFLPALIIPATALAGTLVYNYTPLGAARAGSSRSARPTSSSASARCSRWLVLFAWLKPPRDRAAAGGPAADRRDRLGGGAAADARGARRGVRRRRRRRRDRRGGAPVDPRGQRLPDRARLRRSAWRCSR